MKKIYTPHFICRNILKLVLIALFIQPIFVFADGTRDMYPANYYEKYGQTQGSPNGYGNADYRAVFYTTGSSSTKQPFPTSGTMKVFAKEGEHIYVASSIFSRTKGHIDWGAPDGTTGTYANKSDGVGYIANRTQELAGPKLPNGKCLDGTTNGYDAYVIDVASGQTGVWEISFGVTGATSDSYYYLTNNTNLPYKVEDWRDTTSNTFGQMCAFDISVVDASGNYVPGRVYTNIFNFSMNTRINESSSVDAWSRGGILIFMC